MNRPDTRASAASTSSVHTPLTGRPSTAPMVRAVTSPIRRPVNGPGPTPTAMPVRSPRSMFACWNTCAIAGASSSPCRMTSTCVLSASTCVPSCTATVTAGVAVSKASSTGRGYGVRRSSAQGAGQGSAQVDADPAPADGVHAHVSRVDLVVAPVIRRASVERAGAAAAAAYDDLQPVTRQRLGHPLAPLDHGDRIVERGVEVEVVELLH